MADIVLTSTNETVIIVIFKKVIVKTWSLTSISVVSHGIPISTQTQASLQVTWDTEYYFVHRIAYIITQLMDPMVGWKERWTGDLLEGLAEGLFANSAVGHTVETDDGGAVSCLVEVADGRVVGTTEDFKVGEVVSCVVGLSDGCEGRLVGVSDDGRWLGIAEGRKEGVIVGQAGSDVGVVEGFLVGPSDGCVGRLVGVSDDGRWLGIAEGRKEGRIDRQIGSEVGAEEGFLVGPSDGCVGLLVGDSDDGL
jgi:hypothetical protein